MGAPMYAAYITFLLICVVLSWSWAINRALEGTKLERLLDACWKKVTVPVRWVFKKLGVE